MARPTRPQPTDVLRLIGGVYHWLLQASDHDNSFMSTSGSDFAEWLVKTFNRPDILAVVKSNQGLAQLLATTVTTVSDPKLASLIMDDTRPRVHSPSVQRIAVELARMLYLEAPSYRFSALLTNSTYDLQTRRILAVLCLVAPPIGWDSHVRNAAQQLLSPSYVEPAASQP